MGIQDLLSVLRKKTPDAFSLITLGVYQPAFSGKIVAIDGTLYITRFAKAFGKYGWAGPFFSLLADIKMTGCSPIVVLDTKEGRPVEKSQYADKKRADARETTKKKEQILGNAIHILENADYTRQLSESDTAIIQSAWEYLIKSKKYGHLLSDAHMIDPVERLEVAHRKRDAPPFPSVVHMQKILPIIRTLHNAAKSQLESVDQRSLRDLSGILRHLGIPVINARDSEGEAVCVALQLHKACDYVLSDDSDVLAYGSPCSWRLLSGKNVEQIELPTVLHGLGLSSSQFVDFCILCGTDYNARIKGIGPAKALKLLDTYSDMENIIKVMEKKGVSTNSLNYIRLREIFMEIPHTIALTQVEQDLTLTSNYSTHELESYISDFVRRNQLYIPEQEFGRALGVLIPSRKLNTNFTRMLPLD